MKSIFSIPITATPAAEPMINKLPPVPAQYARPSQNAPSTINAPVASIGYIPIAAATNGTLSMIDESTPITMLIT